MKRKNRGKRLALLGALLCLLALAPGCQRMGDQNVVAPTAEESPGITLKFFGFKSEALNVAAIEEALKAYMDEHPGVTITYESVKGAEYYDVLMKRIRSGNGDDIFMINHDTMLSLMKTGDLADLSGLSTIGDFSPNVRSQMDIDGVIPFVPMSISAFGLYCNMDLLRENGVEVPETREDFLAACEVFAQKGMTPIVANNDTSLKTLALSRGLFGVYRDGRPEEDLERMNADPNLLTTSMRPGFELVKVLIDKGYVDPERALKTERTQDDLTDFATGDYPFMLTGAWASPRVAALKPDFEYQVYPYPTQEDGSVLVTNVDTRVSVNAHSAHVEEARDFLEYMTQKDVLWDFVDSQSSFSPLEDNRLSSDPTVQPLSPYMTNGRSMLGTNSNLDYPIWDISKNSVRQLLKGQSVDAVLKDFEAALEASRDGGAQ